MPTVDPNDSEKQNTTVSMGTGKMTWIGGYVNNCAANSIWFSAPYAFAQAGWLYGTIFFVAIAFTSWTTGLIYADIVNDNYKRILERNSFAITEKNQCAELELVDGQCKKAVENGKDDTVDKISTTSTNVKVCIQDETDEVTLSSLCVDAFVSFLAWYSSFYCCQPSLLMVTGTIVTVTTGNEAASNDYGGINHAPLSVFNGMGVFLFLFGGHSTFPAQMWEMKNPAKFSSMFSGAWGTITIIQLITGVFGFWGYGINTNAVIFRSMAPGTITKIGTILALIYAIYSITLWMNIFFQIYERSLNIPTHRHWGKCVVLVDRNWLKLTVSPVIARGIFRTSILLIQMFIALALPYDLGYIQAFVGSLTIGLDSFFIPPVLYLILRKKGMGYPTWFGTLMLAVFGLFVTVAGTAVSIINIVQSISMFS
eukprot:Awhi_evm1s8825